MSYLLSILLITVCFLLWLYFTKKLNYFKDLGIPYLPGWPVFGNMGPTILTFKSHKQMIDEIYNVNRNALYVGLFDLMRPTILLRDPEIIKNITITNFDYFPDHPNTYDKTLDPLWSENMFSLPKEKWREVRSVVSPTFTSSKLKGMFMLLKKCCENCVDYLAKRTNEENRMVDTKSLFTRLTGDCMARCVYGLEVDSFNDFDNEFYRISKESTDLEKGLGLKFLLARAAPSLLRLFKMKFVDDYAGNFFKAIIGSTVTLREQKGIKRSDMIQLMMDARDKKGRIVKFDLTEMVAQVFVTLFGAFDTTSSQMCVLAHELALNLDIQNKLQKEIDDIMGETGNNPTYDIINESPYLDAVFNESVRLHTQSSVLDRLCVKEYVLPPALPGLKPYVVKPGSSIWIPLASIHRDPRYYENPLEFNPDRYYGKKVSLNDPLNMGFGIGPRGCIGRRFAIMEIKILFFYLLHKFNLRPNGKTCNPLKLDGKSITISAEGGFWLTAIPRN